MIQLTEEVITQMIGYSTIILGSYGIINTSLKTPNHLTNDEKMSKILLIINGIGEI